MFSIVMKTVIRKAVIKRDNFLIEIIEISWLMRSLLIPSSLLTREIGHYDCALDFASQRGQAVFCGERSWGFLRFHGIFSFP